MADKKVEALAVQLYFVSVKTDGGFPTNSWSPMKAMALWEQERESVRKKWIEYAEKVAIFAGLENPTP